MTPLSPPVQPSVPLPSATPAPLAQTVPVLPADGDAKAPSFEGLRRQMQVMLVPAPAGATYAAPKAAATWTVPTPKAASAPPAREIDEPQTPNEDSAVPPLAMLMPWAAPAAPVVSAQVAEAPIADAVPTALASAGPARLPDLAGAMPVTGSAESDRGTSDGEAADFARSLLTALGNVAHHASAPAHRPAFDFAAPTTATDAQPVLDMRSDAWLDRLAQDITASASSDGKLSFRIVPPQLGRLDIHIESRDAGVAVHMKTDTSETQNLVASAQPRLHDAFAAHGLRVSESSVTQNGGSDLPRPNIAPQKALIEAVNDPEPEAAAPTRGQPAGRFA